MVELKESEINQLKAVVGLGDSQNPGREKGPEVTAEDSIIPKAAGPQKEPATMIDVHDTDTDLFVKIDEHVKVGDDLLNSKKEIKGIADTILLLAKAEKLKAEAIERMERHLDRLDETLSQAEFKLTAPESLNMPSFGGGSEVPSDLMDLHTELDMLKDELAKLK